MENWASWSRGVLMYAKLHRPIILMVESSIPAAAAAVAALLLKLWPAKLQYGRPTASNPALISFVNLAFVNG